MAQKKSAKPQQATLNKILSTVERGFTRLEGRMERGFAAVAEDIADIKSTMATKENVRAIVADELAPIRSEIKEIRLELADIRCDLDDIRGKVDNVIGYRKEIDHALERIADIERHLGINKKLAA